jgi:hypothetical protein
MTVTEKTLRELLEGRFNWRAVRGALDAHPASFVANIGGAQLTIGRAPNGHEWIALRCVESGRTIKAFVRPSDCPPDDGE